MEIKMERPKRPLSAYNLFYRFKRSKILAAHVNGDDSKETINRLILAVSGLEEYPSISPDALSSENAKTIRRTQIRLVLKEQLSPKDTSKRCHRKSHGAMSFLEMNKIMCTSWKSIDAFTRSVYEELAEEGRGIYHKRVAEYEGNKMPFGTMPMKSIKPSTAGQKRTKAESKTKKVVVDTPISLEAIHTPQSNQAAGSAPSASTSGAKPKAANKDKDVPRPKPKRPLSSYNLFYRFKRSKILEAHDKGDYTTETVNRLITAVPGLEKIFSINVNISLECLNELRRDNIRLALRDHLSPKDTSKRTHRKSHGAMSFLEMNKLMCSSWKAIDEFARSVFEELADEGRGMYQKRLADYEEKSLDPPKKKVKANSPKDVLTKIVHVPPKIHWDRPTELLKSPPSDVFVVAPNASVNNHGLTPPFVPRAFPPTTLPSGVFVVAPNLVVNHGLIPPVISPASPTAVVSSSFLDMQPEPLPVFPDIFDGEEDKGEQLLSTPGDCVSESSESGASMDTHTQHNTQYPNQYMQGGFLQHMPFSHVMERETRKTAGEATVGDFMKLIATLDDNLCA